MGVCASGLGLIALAHTSGADFSRVVTIGRQQVHVSGEDLQRFFRQRKRADIAARIAADAGDGYCEGLLKAAFGAELIHSIDASDYEQAAMVHDMNRPIEQAQTYSLVVDFGTLEHVFNVPVAFDNVAKLAAPGAHILHVLPSNNFSGHGFYQFSPEFFFQLYAPERGYSGTRVFAAPGGSPDVWYEVKSPRELRRRVDITSRDQLNLLVLTQKTGEPTPLTERPIQQSDYLALWAEEPRRVAKEKRRSEIERMLRAAFNSLRHRRKVLNKDVTRGREDMVRRRVIDLTPLSAQMSALAVALLPQLNNVARAIINFAT